MASKIKVGIAGYGIVGKRRGDFIKINFDDQTIKKSLFLYQFFYICFYSHCFIFYIIS